MDTRKTKLDEFVADAANQKIFEREALVLEATEIISGLMEDGQVNRTTLAQRLGTSKSHVTQLLDGSRNMTLSTLSDILFELGFRASISAKPLRESDCSLECHGRYNKRTSSKNRV